MVRPSFSVVFGEVMRRHRCRLELSQEKLAERANLHRNHIGMLERAERVPSLEVVMQIADALDLTLTKLVGEAERRWRTGGGAQGKRERRRR